MGELLTADEMAKKVRLKPATVLEWARLGKIPSVRVNAKTVRFDPADVVAAMKETSRVASQEEPAHA
jgi:excisionase family DNA binding protein